MSERYFDRLDYDGDLTEEFNEVASRFQLGEVGTYALIPVGYEDVNFQLQTENGSYFVKIFASSRDQTGIDRYAGNIEAAIEAGVQHPKLLQTSDGNHLFRPGDTNLQLLVMEWVDGKSFWDLKTNPTAEERAEIIQAAARINSSDHKPPTSYDSWAVTSFIKEFDEFSGTLTQEDRALVQVVLENFQRLDFKSLPHTFVHGDLIATNVLKTDTGLYVVDFSVANYYPRIQELAVLFSNLLFDETSPENSKKIYNEALKEYSELAQLTDEELEVIGVYIRAAHAMHILGASKAKARGEDDEENQYWLNLGRTGLSFDVY